MRSSITLLQDTEALLDKVDINLRCLSGMFSENSPDALMCDVLVDEVGHLSVLISRLLCHYNSKN